MTTRSTGIEMGNTNKNNLTVFLFHPLESKLLERKVFRYFIHYYIPKACNSDQHLFTEYLKK